MSRRKAFAGCPGGKVVSEKCFSLAPGDWRVLTIPGATVGWSQVLPVGAVLLLGVEMPGAGQREVGPRWGQASAPSCVRPKVAAMMTFLIDGCLPRPIMRRLLFFPGSRPVGIGHCRASSLLCLVACAPHLVQNNMEQWAG